jgi:tripartite-type tricarboxylate transporter receptor subunit TctC
MSFASTPGSIPVVKAGKVKALGVTSAKRIAKLPDVPTVDEAALPGYEASVWYGVVAPTGTPREIVQRLNTEIARIIADPAQRERMVAGDFEPTTSKPEQFAAFIKSETVKWGKVVKASGAKPE